MAEFFVYAVNSILWQRGVYPGTFKIWKIDEAFEWHQLFFPSRALEDTFERKHEYGTVLQVTKDMKLKDYLGNVLGQVEAWAAQGNLQQLVLVIAKVILWVSGPSLRPQFHVSLD